MNCPPKNGRCREMAVVERWQLVQVRLSTKQLFIFFRLNSFLCRHESYPIQYEQQRQRRGIKRSHPSNIVPKRPRGIGTYTKSQSSLLNSYFGFSGFQFSLLLTYSRYGPITCSHLSDHVMFSLQDRRGVASLRYRNCTEITVLVCQQMPHPV